MGSNPILFTKDTKYLKKNRMGAIDMLRDRAYNRKQRFKHIRKRLKIAHDIFRNDWYEENDKSGYLAKNNLACSCACCSPKTRNKGHRRAKQWNHDPNINYKHSDLIKIDRMKTDLQDYESM